MKFEFSYERCTKNPFTEREIVDLQKRFWTSRIVVVGGGLLLALIVGLCFTLYLDDWSAMFAATIVALLPSWLLMNLVEMMISRFIPMGGTLIVEGNRVARNHESEAIKFIDADALKQKSQIEFKSPEAQEMISVIQQMNRPLVRAEWVILKMKENEFKDRLYAMA